MLDRRQARRYRLSAPTVFRWDVEGSRPRRGEGLSRDLGVAGAYILAPERPPLGADIELEIALSNFDNSGPGMHLRGAGKVVRIEQPGESDCGFAATLEFCDEASVLSIGQWQEPSLQSYVAPLIRRRN